MTPALVLVGFMGAGKTTMAAAAAQALGLRWLDVDAVIEERSGRAVTELFAKDGEDTFRALEQEITLELLSTAEPLVLALGGGAVESAQIREELARHRTVWLDIDPETAWERAAGSDRPLARDRDQFTERYRRRQPLYAEVADAVVVGVPRDTTAVLAAFDGLPAGLRLLWATSASAEYPVYLGPQAIAEIDRVEGRRFLVTDGIVGRLYADRLEPLHARVAIVPGEPSKTVAHAEIVWSELARAEMTRADVLVALGGGVVGDLAGFCAATYQRGVRYVQVPTTVVAQVDSAYGGKTGVDLAEAKNYVGAYHQPVAVLTDPMTLQSLPQPERAAGFAEVVKTALIAGGPLWDRVRSGADPFHSEVIFACARTKLEIVARDERDGGLRAVLNLGHTVAHAIESTTGYARYRHGEAVALGLLAALRLSGQEELRAEVLDLLEAQGLPVALDGDAPGAEAIVEATASDKKRMGDGPVPFVLLDAPGRPRPGCPVAPSDLLSAVRELQRL